MIRKIVYTLWLSAGLGSASAQTNQLITYVDPLTGTSKSTTAAAMAHGAGTEQLANTIPAVGTPFGMTQWTPQTRLTEQKCVAPYYYTDSLFSGFRGTHWLNGSCTQDYGSFTIMPVAGALKTAPDEYADTFSDKTEVATPAYYRVQLNKYAIKSELTATARCSMMQFSFDNNSDGYLLIRPNSDRGKGAVYIDRQRKEISGYNPAFRIYQGQGQPAGFSGYFVVQFEEEFADAQVFQEERVFIADSLKDQANIGVAVKLKVHKGSVIRVRAGTSFTSIAAARENLAAEIPNWDFTALASKNRDLWNEALGKITVEGSTEKNKQVFYTALYHSMQHPRLFNDVTGTYPAFAQSYQVKQLESGNYYDDFSMWDIYRAQLPLYEILETTLINDFVRSLILKGQQGGWLPIFPCWNNYTAAMVGDHAIPFIASAWNKGIRNYDIQEAYRLMRQNAFDTAALADYKEGKGRRALSSYLKYGYVPLEDEVPYAFHRREQVSRTLEYAYDDYALSTIAKALHKTSDYNALKKRAGNYANVFDPQRGFVNGRYASGKWYEAPDPDKKESFITEGTPRQYGFYIPHDIPGMIKLYGGKPSFERALDSLFMKQQYWHGNEPGQQIPFLYNYAGAGQKTAAYVNEIRTTEYSTGPGGLCGNDDAGQISAWYVFAAMGFYPVNPVAPEYALTVPAFSNIIIHTGHGTTTTIRVHNDNGYPLSISQILKDGKKYPGLLLQHSDLMKGGVFDIYTGNSEQ
ncbi:GH92 family glycosyl hydrolase [Chitinophaga arvensicola]|uniref:Alpha-1,2-mannosidase, putative n=1 Tax=Chitinophaga arvensicola TaxID=29529 RepID=A0A1I0RMS3_9BACT|nr:GH92 family glycosyl hydrolase [Chitinophaga arvensicola]SEW42522.1 alpha-1,2-mannosidase, putative [Chitinophaga arvensicola]